MKRALIATLFCAISIVPATAQESDRQALERVCRAPVPQSETVANLCMRARSAPIPAAAEPVVPNVRLPIGSWQHVAEGLKAFTIAREGGWMITLSCKDGSGLQATLMNNDPRFPYRITELKGKTAEGQKAQSLTPEQDPSLPGLIHVKGIDSLENSLLRDRRLILRVSGHDMDDAIITLPFPGLSLDADEVLRRCPPF